MFKDIDPGQMKSILIIGLLICSIFAGKFIPVEITHSDAFKEIHYLDK